MDYKTLIGEILAGGIKRWRERQDRGKAQPVAAAATPPTPDQAAESPPPPATIVEPPTPSLGALLTEN
jgi:hypothetical protein